MKKIAIVALLSAMIATPALADNSGKPYFAVDLGSATYTNVSPFNNPGAIRIAGGYHFSPVMAVEVGYTKFGDSKITAGSNSATLSASSFVIALAGTLPLSSQFDLTGKIGMSKNSGDATNTLGASASTSQNSVMFGIGAQYHVTTQTNVHVAYENYGNFDSTSTPMTATAVFVGVGHDF